MKIAVLSDIHGNADALASVLTAAHAAGAERILNAGDLVGYYHQPREVFDLLAKWQVETVRGNHDEMLLAVRRDPAGLARARSRYGSGLDVALMDLSDAQIDWLQGLPVARHLVLDGLRIVVAHGTPEDIDRYVYPDADEALLTRVEAEAGGDTDLVVLGHTHHAKLWDRGGLRILNPGSVGQPRDRRPGAAWALLDTRTGAIELRREPYDRGAVIADARRRDPGLPYLWSVLERT